MKDDLLRKLRHDFKMGATELISAIALHGDNDGLEVDPEDSQEVFNTLENMKFIWIQLEQNKKAFK